MSYSNQLYLEKQKRPENSVEFKQANHVIQARFVANKMIDRYFRNFNENDLKLDPSRLNRLVQLVDLLYRKENQGKPLCCDGYIITSNGLAILQILYGYF